jgi:hypothetical protein
MNDTFNMRNPNPGEVQSLIRQAHVRMAIKRNERMYADIASLLSGRDTVFKSPEVLKAVNLAFNSEKLTFGEYERLFPEEFMSAKIAAKQRCSADKMDYNPHSKAKWRQLGYLPPCISRLFGKVYHNDADRKKARQRFWSEYPALKVHSYK